MTALEYRLFPSKAQESILNETLAVCRLVQIVQRVKSITARVIYRRDETEDHETEGYEIAHILSHLWWDNCVWDLVLDTKDE